MPGISSRNDQNPGKGTRYRYGDGERKNSPEYHYDCTDGSFRSARQGAHGGYSERRPMDSDNYPPEGGMLYKDFYNANASFCRMFQGKARAWVVYETVAFAEREKTVDQSKKYFHNLMRFCVSKSASRE